MAKPSPRYLDRLRGKNKGSPRSKDSTPRSTKESPPHWSKSKKPTQPGPPGAKSKKKASVVEAAAMIQSTARDWMRKKRYSAEPAAACQEAEAAAAIQSGFRRKRNKSLTDRARGVKESIDEKLMGVRFGMTRIAIETGVTSGIKSAIATDPCAQPGLENLELTSVPAPRYS